jgi:hypothetical protein
MTPSRMLKSAPNIGICPRLPTIRKGEIALSCENRDPTLRFSHVLFDWESSMVSWYDII